MIGREGAPRGPLVGWFPARQLELARWSAEMSSIWLNRLHHGCQHRLLRPHRGDLLVAATVMKIAGKTASRITMKIV